MSGQNPPRSPESEAMRAALSAEFVFHMECWKKCEDLSVFKVYNSNSRPITVLAKDAKCAVNLAQVAGHIKEERNGVASKMPDEEVAKLRKDGSALGRAIVGGLPGVVQKVGNNVMLKGRDVVYIPLRVVID